MKLCKLCQNTCSILKTCDMKLGQGWLLFYFVWTINFYSAQDFALGLSFIIQQQCWRLYAPWQCYDGLKFLGFAYWCLFLFLSLSNSLCCAYQIWLVCVDFVMVTCCTCFMFLELPVLEVRSINANRRFLRWDFKKLSNNLCCVVCFWFLRIIVCEMNAQVNQTTVLLFFYCARSLVWLLGGSMNMQITKTHGRWWNTQGV